MKHPACVVVYLLLILALMACSASTTSLPATHQAVTSNALVPTLTPTIAPATMEPFNPEYKPWVPEDVFKNKTDQERAGAMVGLWLDNFKKGNADRGHRISEYTIDSIDASSKWERYATVPPYMVVALVSFSVKPVSLPSDWTVGSGELSMDDGWVHRKSILLGVLPENNGYRFINLTLRLT